MHLVGRLRVTISGKLVQTVVKINSKHDATKIGAECDIVVPLNSRIQYIDGRNDYLTELSRVLFKVGDSVKIETKYDGYEWLTEFEGFIFDFVEGMPLTIKCLDWAYFLNLGVFGDQRILRKKNKKSKAAFASIGCSFKSISLKNLLQKIVDFTNDTIDDSQEDTSHIELLLPIPDLQLVDITFSQMSPMAILEYFKKEIGMNISLNRNYLYVNIASNTLGVVKYSTDRNVFGRGLQKSAAAFQKWKVKAWFIREDGTRDSYEVGDSSGQSRDVFFYRIERSQSTYEKMANEALAKLKQMKYSGTIKTRLYPFPNLFDKAIYKDIRYPELNANYTITGKELNIDENGYTRNITLAYLSEIQ